jgi:hypothetical protein
VLRLCKYIHFMLLQQRINAFVQLRNHLHFEEDFLYKVEQYNPWFTQDFIKIALKNISENFLEENKIKNWTESYPIAHDFTNKKIGLIAAGNIPLVVFHDIMCILIAGHTLLLKQSDKDKYLTKAVLDKLIEIEPLFADKIIHVEQLKNFDAVIATGSNNSGRYFDYYFGKYPHIIRKNRNSLAVLSGSESTEQLEALADDIFMYFGLGCRNVSLLFLPEGYDFKPLLTAFNKYEELQNHHKYKGNLDYYRTLHLMNIVPMIDIDFINLTENDSLLCAISDIHFSFYKNYKEVEEYITLNQNNIQCVVTEIESFTNRIDFGQSQRPDLNAYADNIDTLKFLTSLV